MRCDEYSTLCLISNARRIYDSPETLKGAGHTLTPNDFNKTIYIRDKEIA